MTREEGKEFANALKNNYTIDFDKLPEFCDLVISALSELGTKANEAIKPYVELAHSVSAEGEYIKKEDALKLQYRIDDSATLSTRDVVDVDDIEDLPTYSSPEREKGTDGTLVYNADGHFYGVMGGDAIMERIRGKVE